MFPLGKLWARLCPSVRICGHSLNPGPFSMKEHVRFYQSSFFKISDIFTGPGNCDGKRRCPDGLCCTSVSPTTHIDLRQNVQSDIIAVQRVYYNQRFAFSCTSNIILTQTAINLMGVDRWMLVISTQLIGFSMGGIARRFLVSPPSMIWPNTLVQCALFNTLHSQEYSGIGEHRDRGVSRERYFVYIFLGAAAWCAYLYI